MQPGRTVSVWEEALPLPCCWLCTADPEVGDTGARRGRGVGAGLLFGGNKAKEETRKELLQPNEEKNVRTSEWEKR